MCNVRCEMCNVRCGSSPSFDGRKFVGATSQSRYAVECLMLDVECGRSNVLVAKNEERKA